MAKKLNLIFGLAGKKHSGKTTAADLLVDHYAKAGWSAVRVGFADKLKRDVAKVFGPYKEEQKSVLRPVYQAVGQAMKEIHGQTVWLEAWRENQHTLIEKGYNVFIIDDVRFPFEADFIRALGGEVYRIKRPETDVVVDNHPSETYVDEIVPDRVIPASDLKELHEELHKIHYA